MNASWYRRHLDGLGADIGVGGSGKRAAAVVPPAPAPAPAPAPPAKPSSFFAAAVKKPPAPTTKEPPARWYAAPPGTTPGPAPAPTPTPTTREKTIFGDTRLVKMQTDDTLTFSPTRRGEVTESRNIARRVFGGGPASGYGGGRVYETSTILPGSGIPITPLYVVPPEELPGGGGGGAAGGGEEEQQLTLMDKFKRLGLFQQTALVGITAYVVWRLFFKKRGGSQGSGTFRTTVE